MLFRRNHRKAQFGAFCLGGGGSARRNGSKAPSAWSLNGFRWSARMERAQATSWRLKALAVSLGDASDALSSATAGASGVGSKEARETSTLVLHLLREELWELEFSEARSRSSSALDALVSGAKVFMTIKLPSTLTTWWSSAVFWPPEPMVVVYERSQRVWGMIPARGTSLGRLRVYEARDSTEQLPGILC